MKLSLTSSRKVALGKSHSMTLSLVNTIQDLPAEASSQSPPRAAPTHQVHVSTNQLGERKRRTYSSQSPKRQPPTRIAFSIVSLCCPRGPKGFLLAGVYGSPVHNMHATVQRFVHLSAGQHLQTGYVSSHRLLSDLLLGSCIIVTMSCS